MEESKTGIFIQLAIKHLNLGSFSIICANTEQLMTVWSLMCMTALPPVVCIPTPKIISFQISSLASLIAESSGTKSKHLMNRKHFPPNPTTLLLDVWTRWRKPSVVLKQYFTAKNSNLPSKLKELAGLFYHLPVNENVC